MVASNSKPKDVQVVAKIMYSWNQLNEKVWQTSKLHNEGSIMAMKEVLGSPFLEFQLFEISVT